MKVILYLITSLDGYIAKSDHSANWSAEAWNHYFTTCARFKNIILGRKSYELMLQDPTADQLEVNTRIVVSKSMGLDNHNGYQIVRSPKEALLRLEELGVLTALVIGGSGLATSFLNEGLIDEMCIDVDGRFIQTGIPFLKSPISDSILRIISADILGPHTVTLRFEVLKRVL